MGQIAGADLIVLTKGLKVTFFKAYDARTPHYPEVCTIVQSSAVSETHGWLGTSPEMQEWKDERTPKGLLDHNYTIENLHYENSIGVDLDDLADDQIGQIYIRINDLGERARTHPDKLLNQLRVNGTSNLCYDGQYFYDTDHSEGSSGTQSNIITGSGLGLSNIEADIDAAVVAFLTFKDDRGAPYFDGDDLEYLITAPPALKAVFEKLLKSMEISGSTNTKKDFAKLRIDNRLTNTKDYYIDIVNRYVKPFIFQNRQEIQFTTTNSKNQDFMSDIQFMSKVVYYGADARYNFGYGLWQESIKVNNS